MKHDCRLRSLEVFEDEEGYLFVRDQCHMLLGKEVVSRVEYCPICGMKGKKSHVENINMYPRDDVECPLQQMHNNIIELFLSSCNIIAKEDLKDHEYQYCLDTIHNTIFYIGSKRKEKKYETLQNLRGFKECLQE
jgi:hypothetical protein